MERGKKTRDSIEKARTDKLLEEQKTCSFNPQVSMASQKIIQRKSQNKTTLDVCTDLYEENKIRQEKQKELAEMITNTECSFRPDIGKNSNLKREENNSEFLERLVNSKREQEEKLEQMRQQMEHDQCVVNPKTGRPYFKPLVDNRAQEHGTEVFDHLYSKAIEKWELDKQRLLEEEQKQKEIAKQKIMKGNSEQIQKKVEQKRINEIFNTIVPEGNDKITKEEVNLDNLDPNVSKVLTPLIQNIQKNNLELTQNDFYNEVQKYLRTIPLSERQIIFQKEYKYVSPPQSFPFQPNAEKLEKEQSQLGKAFKQELIQRLTTKNTKKEEIIKQEQEEREIKELEPCTFKPQVNKLPKYIIERKKQLQEQKRNAEQNELEQKQEEDEYNIQNHSSIHPN